MLTMIANNEVARELSPLLIECMDLMGRMVELVARRCSEEDLRMFRLAMAEPLVAFDEHILQPFYCEHLDLAPPQMAVYEPPTETHGRRLIRPPLIDPSGND
jgi:hypothetical protein